VIDNVCNVQQVKHLVALTNDMNVPRVKYLVVFTHMNVLQVKHFVAFTNDMNIPWVKHLTTFTNDLKVPRVKHLVAFTSDPSPRKMKRSSKPKDPVNYRPITNINTINKIFERLANKQLQEHLPLSPNFNTFQSAYWSFHLTETAKTKVINDLQQPPIVESHESFCHTT